MRSNYSLFKNSAARSARLNKESGVQGDRPVFRRSNLAGSAARAARLADEERKRQSLEVEAPGAGERADQSLKSEKQVSIGLRAGGGTPFERARKVEPEPEVSAAAAEPAAPPATEPKTGGLFSKIFSVFGGSK